MVDNPISFFASPAALSQRILLSSSGHHRPKIREAKKKKNRKGQPQHQHHPRTSFSTKLRGVPDAGFISSTSTLLRLLLVQGICLAWSLHSSPPSLPISLSPPVVALQNKVRSSPRNPAFRPLKLHRARARSPAPHSSVLAELTSEVSLFFFLFFCRSADQLLLLPSLVLVQPVIAQAQPSSPLVAHRKATLSPPLGSFLALSSDVKSSLLQFLRALPTFPSRLELN